MSVGGDYTENWIGYWMYVWQRASEGWSRAVRGMQQRNYEFKDLYGDVTGFWTDVAVASANAWRGQERKPPILVFEVDVADDCHGPKSVSVFAPAVPFKTPSLALQRLDRAPHGDGQEITAENIAARLSQDRRELEVKLIGLKAELISGSRIRDPHELLAPATYRALIHIEEVPLAELFIVVSRKERLRAAARARPAPPTEPPRP